MNFLWFKIIYTERNVAKRRDNLLSSSGIMSYKANTTSHMAHRYVLAFQLARWNRPRLHAPVSERTENKTTSGCKPERAYFQDVYGTSTGHLEYIYTPAASPWGPSIQTQVDLVLPSLHHKRSCMRSRLHGLPISLGAMESCSARDCM